MKKEAYISFNREESTRLRLMGWRERWMYTELKWLANFKTGVVGAFGRQCLTYEAPAGRVMVPASQGRSADVIDGKEAARLIDRLRLAGLVENINLSDGKFECKLPLSPIKKDAVPEAPSATSLTAKLPVEAPPENTVKPCQLGVSNPSIAGQSVLEASYFNTIFNTGGSSGGASIGEGDRLALDVWQLLTRDHIMERLKRSKRSFMYVSSSVSGELYESWIFRRVSIRQFEAAVCAVEVDTRRDATPVAIERQLARLKSASRRSLVAL